MLHRMTPKESDISTPLAPDSTPLIAAFAQRELNGHDDLRDHDIMPAALWQAIGAAGLAQIGLPVEYGGTGGGFRILASAAETLSAEGGIKGVTTSWLGRQLISRLLILGQGNEAQRREYLPDLAAGRLTPSLAISEPGAGAHPKHLQTTAERAGDGFILNGEKAYVTNGPIADVFLVMAITATHESRKRYSILIVPRNTPGLTLTEGVKIDFLHPARIAGCASRMSTCRIATCWAAKAAPLRKYPSPCDASKTPSPLPASPGRPDTRLRDWPPKTRGTPSTKRA